jgi:carbon starvation protein
MIVIWGWIPAMLWVVFGTLFIGAVHDFGALVVSMRARGMSIGKVAESIVSKRAKTLFHIIIFFLIALAMGVFVHVCSTLLTTAYNPEAVYPSATLMVLALVVGWLVYRKNLSIWRITAVALVITLCSVWLGIRLPTLDLTLGTWSILLLLYSLVASVLPVWILLQPRDYLNSLLLYLGLAAIYTGFFVLRPEFAAPALQTHPQGAPPLFPFVFIVVACGAISGFHGLVSSGTTAKQINKESDATLIGYGGMIGESLLGLASVLACTAGFLSRDLWMAHYNSWELADGLGPNMQAFIDGSALFLSQLGLPLDVGKAFVALVAISFALTTLDSATRLLRFNIAEMSETFRLPFLANRYIASLLAVTVIGFFAFYKVNGQAAGLALWQLFGTTNQVLGGLTLLTVTLYLMQRGRPYWYTGLPMVFMLITTLTAMVIKIRDFWNDGTYLLLILGGGIFLLSLWLGLEAVLRVTANRGQRKFQIPNPKSQT